MTRRLALESVAVATTVAAGRGGRCTLDVWNRRPKTLFIVNDAPYGTERCYNALRLAGSLAKRDGEEVKAFLIGDAASELTDTTRRSSLDELTTWVQWADRDLGRRRWRPSQTLAEVKDDLSKYLRLAVDAGELSIDPARVPSLIAGALFPGPIWQA